MLFVPIVPQGPAAPPSPRVRELSDLLGRVIEEYEKHHPAVTGAEVREAVRLATQRSQAGGGASAQVALAAGLGALVVAGVVAFAAFEGGGGGGVPMVAVAVATLLVIMLLVVVNRSRGP